jgi:glucose uptake protein
MVGTFAALITVLAWGTWLAPSQNIPFRSQQVKTFYVAAANLVLAIVVTLFQKEAAPDPGSLWLPFVGGLIWSVSGLCAFTATEKIGIAKAFGVWAPVNIIVSILWGAVLFGEFLELDLLNTAWLFISLAIIIAGVLMIILSKGDREKKQNRRTLVIGILCSVGAGILWGTYYIPIKISENSMWVSTLPMAAGIFAGSGLLVWFSRLPLALVKGADYARVGLTGLLWGIGNYGMLVLVDQLGAGRGFTISQLSVVVNALVGIFILRDPAPRTRAAWFTLAGCVLATLGAIILGNLK